MSEKFITIDLAGFTDVKKARTARERALDRHVIVTAKCTPDLWDVEDVQFGRWGTKECAARIVDAYEKHDPLAWGMEKGALYNAVLPYINDEAVRRGISLKAPEPLSHENRVKKQRIAWALQGRMEHGRIRFKRAPWNKELEEELLMFPSETAHDDIIDALAYLEQLTRGRCLVDLDQLDIPDTYWSPTDPILGY